MRRFRGRRRRMRCGAASKMRARSVNRVRHPALRHRSRSGRVASTRRPCVACDRGAGPVDASGDRRCRARTLRGVPGVCGPATGGCHWHGCCFLPGDGSARPHGDACRRDTANAGCPASIRASRLVGRSGVWSCSGYPASTGSGVLVGSRAGGLHPFGGAPSVRPRPRVHACGPCGIPVAADDDRASG